MAISSGTILKVVASLLMPDSVIAQNVFYSVVADLVTSDDEADVVDDIITWVEAMYDNIKANIVSGVTTSDVKVYEYDSIDDDWDEVGSDTWSITMSNGNDMLPHGVAIVCHAKSLDPDVQATKYIPGFADSLITESDVQGGAVTTTALFCADWVTAFTGAATGGDFGPGVWSTVGTVFKLFNGDYSVNGQVGYQRRRKPGVGI